jgi:hypothetical protein
MTNNLGCIEEKIGVIENICVVHPRMKALFNEFDQIRHDSVFAAEPSCMFLVGRSGAGKTTAINSYRRRHPDSLSDDGSVIPIFAASLPSPATIKGVAERILQMLRAPKPGIGTAVNMTARIVRLLNGCKVELVILDEFQHLLQRGSKKNFDEVSDWVKDLINMSGVPVVMVGTPGSEEILRVNPQLDRRVKTVATLHSFDYKNSPSDLEKFLGAVHAALPFANERNSLRLSDTSCASRIFLVSDGLPGRAMRLIREAAKLAVRADASFLTDDHFSQAFQLYFEGRTKYPNPWSLSAGRLEDTLGKHYKDAADLKPRS